MLEIGLVLPMVRPDGHPHHLPLEALVEEPASELLRSARARYEHVVGQLRAGQFAACVENAHVLMMLVHGATRIPESTGFWAEARYKQTLRTTRLTPAVSAPPGPSGTRRCVQRPLHSVSPREPHPASAVHRPAAPCYRLPGNAVLTPLPPMLTTHPTATPRHPG